MSLGERITSDINKMTHYYQNLQQREQEVSYSWTEEATTRFVYTPGIYELVNIAAICTLPLEPLSNPRRADLVCMRWDFLKHSPILILGTLAIAASHSKEAAGSLIGAYLIKKLCFN